MKLIEQHLKEEFENYLRVKTKACNYHYLIKLEDYYTNEKDEF
jgi:hypothetical protein